MLKSIVAALGPLRVMLAVMTVLVILAAPFAEVSPELVTGWAMWPRTIAPAFMPIIAFVLPLDIIMSRLIMMDKPPESRARYRFIIWCDLILLTILVLAWLPFLSALFGD